MPDFGLNESSRSVNWQRLPALSPEAMFALDKEEVLLRYDRRLRMSL